MSLPARTKGLASPKTFAAATLMLLGLAMLAAASPPLASLSNGGPPLETSAQAPSPRDLTFYMHNSTIAKDVNGISSPYIFDTLQKFGRNNTITNLQQVTEDWYLFPVLAGNLTVNGSISMHAYVSVSGASPSLQSQTLSIYEISAAGVHTLVASNTFGNVPWFNTPHDLVLALPSIVYTFPAGSSIRVLLSIQLGTRTGTLWYNDSWVPTHLILPSEDFAQTQSIAFLDASGTVRQNFDALAADKTITIRANVTDPLGGYDIAWVNLTLVQPGGSVVLASVPMTKTSGTPLSYVSTYELVWNYGGHPVGRYNATVAVLDNSGWYYFGEFYTPGGFLAQLDAFFYVGGLPVYVNVRTVDSKGALLVGAVIDLVSANVTLDSKTSDANGLANFTMEKGTYTFSVVWKEVGVASPSVTVSANVSAADPQVIACRVYDPAFQALDADGRALADASLIFLTPSGRQIGPYKTDANGTVDLVQAPGGAYAVNASWRGVYVYAGVQTVSSNGVISFRTAVYELTVTADGANGQPVAGVFVSVVDSTGLVFDAGVTGTDGQVVLRLPAGSYTVDYRFVTTYSGSAYDSGVRTAPVTLTSSTSTTVSLGDFPPPFTSTLEFVFVLAYVLTVAALAVALLLLWRRKSGGKKSEPAPADEKKH